MLILLILTLAASLLRLLACFFPLLHISHSLDASWAPFQHGPAGLQGFGFSVQVMVHASFPTGGSFTRATGVCVSSALFKRNFSSSAICVCVEEVWEWAMVMRRPLAFQRTGACRSGIHKCPLYVSPLEFWPSDTK